MAWGACTALLPLLLLLLLAAAACGNGGGAVHCLDLEEGRRHHHQSRRALQGRHHHLRSSGDTITDFPAASVERERGRNSQKRRPRGGGWRHGARAEAPQLQLRAAGEQQEGGGGRSPVHRRRARLVAAAAHRAVQADDQLVGRGGGGRVQGAGARHARRQAPDAQLRGHRRPGRRRGHGDRGHGQRAHVGAVRALRVVPRPAGPALRPGRVAVLRRGAVQLLLLRRAAAGHGHVGPRGGVRRPGPGPAAAGLQLHAQLPRRLLLPRRPGARQAQPGRGGHRRLRLRLRHQQPGPALRRHVWPHGARPEPALARLPDHGPVRRRLLLLPAAQGVRLVGIAGPRRRLVGVPELDPDRVRLDGVRPAPRALLLRQPDRDHGRRPGGGILRLLGRRRQQGHHRLRHRDHQPRAVDLQRCQGRVLEPAGGVPTGSGVLHPRHLLQHDRVQRGSGAQPEARVRRRRGGGGGLRRGALLRQQRLVPGVPGHGRPEIRVRDLHHRQLPAEELEGHL